MLSPDGAWLAYATKDPSLESNILSEHPNGFLWVAKIGEKRVRIAEGEYGDTPSGRPMAVTLRLFVRSRDAANFASGTQLGKVQELGESFPKDDSLWPTQGLAPAWNMSGDTIVFASVVPAPPAADPESQIVHGTDAVMPGDMPFLDLRKWTLFAVNVSTNKVRALTPQPVPLVRFSISHDGSRMMYRTVSRRLRDSLPPRKISRMDRAFKRQSGASGFAPGTHSGVDGFFRGWSRAAFSEKERCIQSMFREGTIKLSSRISPVQSRDPQVSANGMVAVIAARPGTAPTDTKMYTIIEPTWDVLVVKPGQAAPLALTGSEQDTQNGELAWSADGKALFYRSDDEQTYRETIHRWQSDSGTSTAIYSADRSIHALNPSHDGSVLAFTAQSATAPDDGYLLESGKTEARRITDLNPQLASFTFQAPACFAFTMGMSIRLQGMLFLPPGTDSNHKVPVVTWVYEKLSPFKNRFDPDAQWYVARLRILDARCVGEQFFAEAYLTCVVPAVNAVRDMDVSTGKFGISGGSLGGFAGLALISRSDIFAAAVLRAPPSDYFSTWGDGRDRDIWTIEDGQGRAAGTPWEQPETSTSTILLSSRRTGSILPF